MVDVYPDQAGADAEAGAPIVPAAVRGGDQLSLCRPGPSLDHRQESSPAFRDSLRAFGWRPRPPRYLILGYVIPLVYGLAIYATVWITGLGDFQERSLVLLGTRMPFVVSLVVMSLTGLLPACGAAMGEEIGWRGLLVPGLAKITTFTRTALLTGMIWAVWHYPSVIFAD